MAFYALSKALTPECLLEIIKALVEIGPDADTQLVFQLLIGVDNLLDYEDPAELKSQKLAQIESSALLQILEYHARGHNERLQNISLRVLSKIKGFAIQAKTK